YITCSLFFFSSRRRHTRSKRDWSSDVCSSDLPARQAVEAELTLRDAHNAWQALWTSVGGQQTGGSASRILAICNPSPDEWLTHSSRRPNSLPAPGDVWATVQAGFTLDLAHDIRAAKARYDHISRSIDGDREKRQLEYGRAKSWGTYR